MLNPEQKKQAEAQASENLDTSEMGRLPLRSFMTDPATFAHHFHANDLAAREVAEAEEIEQARVEGRY
jgi:hypothetical protein